VLRAALARPHLDCPLCHRAVACVRKFSTHSTSASASLKYRSFAIAQYEDIRSEIESIVGRALGINSRSENRKDYNKKVRAQAFAEKAHN
jgi:hypothetical protein